MNDSFAFSFFSPSFRLRLFTFSLKTIRATMRGSSGPECKKKKRIIVVVHDHDSCPGFPRQNGLYPFFDLLYLSSNG